MNNFISQNKAGLCIGGGLAFMLFGAGLAAIFSPKAVQAIEDKKEELGVDELPVGEKIKTSIGYYLPTIGFEILGASMILYGNQVNLKNEAAIMAAYAMNETALQITRDKIREVVGEKKEKDIQESVANDLLERNKSKSSTVIITDNGDRLCFDNIINQYFKSSKTRVETAINKLNFDIINGRGVVTLNDYCLALGLPEVELGTELGWGLSNPINATFGSKLLDNGDPCVSIFHNNIPKPINLI